jgi:hypothetical protein
VFGALMNMIRSWPMASMLLALLVNTALGQTLPSLSGSTSLSPNGIRHKGPTGQPCLAFGSYARAQAINKSIYEHWVTATNSCGQNLKVQVCYHSTTDCILMNVPPWEQTQRMLGIYPVLKDFRYDTKEQF